MKPIKLWGKGDEALSEALSISQYQGEAEAKIETDTICDWEKDWLVDRVNGALAKFDIEPVKDFNQALEYKYTVMPLKMKAMDLLEEYGRQLQAMGH